jgi:hypothetical protein
MFRESLGRCYLVVEIIFQISQTLTTESMSGFELYVQVIFSYQD